MARFFVDPDIAKAKTIDTKVYLSQDEFNDSVQKIFAPSWQYIGSKDDLLQANVVPFDLLNGLMNVPLILTLDPAGKLHCLSNVCTHRGNILAANRCHQRQISCKYHGRRFDLQGKFLFMPEFAEVENFPTDDDHLPELPLYAWGKWLFTSLGLDSAEKYLGDMIQRMHWLPFDQFVFRPNLSHDYVVNAHWALYCENYLEGFHIPFVHGSLNEVLDFGAYTTELFAYSSLQLGLAEKEEAVFDLPETSVDFGKKVAGYYWWIFPNMMFNFYPWGLSVNIVKPVSVDKTVVSFLSFVSDERFLEKGAGADVHTVELEDEEIVHAVQKGIRSPLYRHGRYSVTREQGTHHFHRLLAQHLS